MSTQIQMEKGWTITVSMVNDKPFITMEFEDAQRVSHADSIVVDFDMGEIKIRDWRPTQHKDGD